MIQKPTKIILISLIFFQMLFLFSSINLHSQEKERIKVIEKNTPLRLKPNSKSTIIKTISVNSKLEVEEIIGDWVKVKLPPNEEGIIVTGYIHQNNVEKIPSEPLERGEIEKEEKRLTSKSKSEVISSQKRNKFPKMAIGMSGGYSMPLEENYSNHMAYGGNLSFLITQNIAIEISGIVFQSDVEKDPQALSSGKLTTYPIGLSLQARLPINHRFIPYIVGGGSYYENKFNLNNDLVSSWNSLGFDIREEVESVASVHFGAGLDFFISKNFALNVDGKYFLNKPAGSWSIVDQITDEEVSSKLDNLNMNSIFIGFGLKFFFSL